MKTLKVKRLYCFEKMHSSSFFTRLITLLSKYPLFRLLADWLINSQRLLANSIYFSSKWFCKNLHLNNRPHHQDVRPHSTDRAWTALTLWTFADPSDGRQHSSYSRRNQKHPSNGYRRKTRTQNVRIWSATMPIRRRSQRQIVHLSEHKPHPK